MSELVLNSGECGEFNVITRTGNQSGEDVTVDEIFGHFVVTNIPLKVLLKDTISDTIAEGID